jgi:hypothetical protein
VKHGVSIEIGTNPDQAEVCEIGKAEPSVIQRRKVNHEKQYATSIERVVKVEAGTPPIGL